ncbi:glutaminyl-peptide cyclotransferase [Blumeria hordei DH14]|uniref:Peptide hydrolase n=1 Tax=Blumeria graminis f. sp. hordei (strain DH14) TaxID=546991 RepID=N1JG43_BLUG1|nr:glutaminyl-peptide cyclotransferase [Blumeria hordei DH14]
MAMLLLLHALLWPFVIQTVDAYTPLSNDTLQRIPSVGSDFDVHTGSILAPILIPRVSGTDGSTKVQRHFVDWFTTQLPHWQLTFQNSTSTTPVTGTRQVPFVNLILTRDPPWTTPGDVGHLTLAAHFDSKYDPPGFIGATDSAAPCAMIMHVARSLDAALTRKWAAMESDQNKHITGSSGIQIIFFDGEEAFQTWSDTDSLYGSRSLAEAWEATPHAAMSAYHNKLSSIDLLVLLDLLGAANTVIPSYFETTHWAYKNLASIETRMRSLGLLKAKVTSPILPDSEKSKFNSGLTIQDDHIPLMKRGVEILHLIPARFPKVWHTMADNADVLDPSTMDDWAKIITAFAGEWMDVEGYFSEPAQPRIQKSELVAIYHLWTIPDDGVWLESSKSY